MAKDGEFAARLSWGPWERSLPLVKITCTPKPLQAPQRAGAGKNVAARRLQRSSSQGQAAVAVSLAAPPHPPLPPPGRLCCSSRLTARSSVEAGQCNMAGTRTMLPLPQQGGPRATMWERSLHCWLPPRVGSQRGMMSWPRLQSCWALRSGGLKTRRHHCWQRYAASKGCLQQCNSSRSRTRTSSRACLARSALLQHAAMEAPQTSAGATWPVWAAKAWPASLQAARQASISRSFWTVPPLQNFAGHAFSARLLVFWPIPTKPRSACPLCRACTASRWSS